MSLQKQILNFAGYDVSNLDAYVKENQDELIAKNVGTARSMSLLNVVDGIKHTERVGTMDDDTTWQTGTGCGFTPDDDTEFGKFDLSVAPIKWEKEWCNEDLVGLRTELKLLNGAAAQQEVLPFEEQITSLLIGKNALKIDRAIWRSDSSLSTGDLSYFDGLATQIYASGDAVECNTGGLTAITSANAYDALYNMILHADSTIGNDVVQSGTFKLFAGKNIMMALLKNYIDNDWYNLNPSNQSIAILTQEIFGTGVILESCPGLDGTNYIVGGRADRLYVGTDGVADTAQFKLWYNEDTDTIRARSKFRLGTGLPFFDQVAKFTLESGS